MIFEDVRSNKINFNDLSLKLINKEIKKHLIKITTSNEIPTIVLFKILKTFTFKCKHVSIGKFKLIM